MNFNHDFGEKNDNRKKILSKSAHKVFRLKKAAFYPFNLKQPKIIRKDKKPKKSSKDAKDAKDAKEKKSKKSKKMKNKKSEKKPEMRNPRFSSEESIPRRSISFGRQGKKKSTVSDRLHHIGRLYNERKKSKEKEFYKNYFRPDISVSQDSYRLSKKNFDIIKKIDAEIKRKHDISKESNEKDKIKPVAKLKDIKKNVLGKKKKGKTFKKSGK